MQGDDLQQMVDSLAVRLGRSVAIDDPSLRLLAASRHFGDEDPLRVRAVLRRELDRSAAEHLLSHGMAHWDGHGRVPGIPQLDFKPRLCFPVRCEDLLLGYLWLIDDGAITAGEIEESAAVAADAGLLLYRRLLLHERERTQEEALLRDLLFADPDARVRAGEEIDEGRLLRSADRIAVAVLEVDSTGGHEQGRDVAMRTAVEHVVRQAAAGSALTLVQGRHVVMLYAFTRSAGQEQFTDLVRQTADEVRARAGVVRVVAGLGTEQPGLDAAALSHDQARTAVRAASALPALGDVVPWASLGVYGLLIQLAPAGVPPAFYPPSLLALVERDDRGTLLETAEVYLDNAGDVRRAAEALHVHRTTLYYRLQRVEEVTGLDLQNGVDRLSLHLGMKLLRLRGADG
jgi:sugar diacid utilization regulator